MAASRHLATLLVGLMVYSLSLSLYAENNFRAYENDRFRTPMEGLGQQRKSSVASKNDKSTLSEPLPQRRPEKGDKTVHGYDKHDFRKDNPAAPVCHVLKGSNEVNFTLAIHLSQNRLWLMKEHCKRWGKANPISVAVAIEDVGIGSEHALKQQLHGLGCETNKMAIAVVENQGPEQDYPINKLRNLALAAVPTSHAVILDADTLLSMNAVEQLQKHATALLDMKTALVIPAFEMRPQCTSNYLDSDSCRKLHVSSTPGTKTELLREFMNNSSTANITQFRKEFPAAHRATRYSDWCSQDDDQLIPIECPMNHLRYEPYLVFRYCRNLPPFQEAFTGHGENKRTWVRQLIRSGWSFYQTGGSFLVHLPHSKSASHKAWDAERRLEVTKIARRFKSWMDDNIPDATQTQYCVPSRTEFANDGSHYEKRLSRVERLRQDYGKYDFRKTNPAAPVCHALKDRKEVGFTLAIHLSQDRVRLMEEHCKRWGKENPISIAVSMEDVGFESEHALKQQLHGLGCDTNKMAITVVENPGADEGYPINKLRNLALAGVTTTHSVVLDADSLLSPNTYKQLNQHRDSLLDLKTALAIPAFALRPQCISADLDSNECRKLHLSLMPHTKTELLKAFLSNSSNANITQFKKELPAVHGSTRYNDWCYQDDDKLIPIQCPKERYEPYLVFRYCRDVPPFQEAFTGHGENKLTWIRQLVRSGWKFYQIGGSFLVHLPHAKSSPQKALDRQRRLKITEIARRFRTWMYDNIPDETQTNYCVP